MAENVLFLGKVFEVEFFRELRLFRSPESKIPIFDGWSESMRFLYPHKLKTNNSSKFKFGILIAHHMEM